MTQYLQPVIAGQSDMHIFSHIPHKMIFPAFDWTAVVMWDRDIYWNPVHEDDFIFACWD